MKTISNYVKRKYSINKLNDKGGTSWPMMKTWIIELVNSNNFSSIIDLGVGRGETGVMLRDSGYDNVLDGVEYYAGGISEECTNAYNNIFIGSIQEYIDYKTKDHDLGVLMDVIEHFDAKVGINILQFLFSTYSNVVISTPVYRYIQRADPYNELEAHKTYWDHKSFMKLNPTYVKIYSEGGGFYAWLNHNVNINEIEYIESKVKKKEIGSYIPSIIKDEKWML